MSIDRQFEIFDGADFETSAEQELQVNRFRTYRVLPYMVGLNPGDNSPTS